ncbi:MAG: PAS domain-containing protein [Burkholderiaceae bacterium]|nr:PAS domain-containing protein [Burkholderiaceae bacterium]
MADSPATSSVLAHPAAAPGVRRVRDCADEVDRALRQLMATDGVPWEQQLITGRWWCSPTLHRLLGLEDSMPPSASPFDRCVAEDRERIDDACAEAIRQRSGFTLDLRLLDSDGHFRWWRCTARVLPGTSGTPEYLAGVLREVHAEKEAVLRLEAVAARFNRAMEASSGAHFERTSGLDDFFVSDRICTLLGYPSGTPAPAREVYFSWVHPDDRAALHAQIVTAGAGPGLWESVYRLRHRDGSFRWFRARGRSELDPHGRLRMTGMISDTHEQTLMRRDIEQQRQHLEAMVEERTARLESALAEAQRQREQAERANESKSTFLAHMSHEIRTPLNGVLGLNELALREATSTQQKRYLKLALQSGRNLLGIINDVLDFSRLSAGALTAADEPFDLCDAMAESLRAIMPAARTQGLGLIYDHVGNISRVVGDCQRMQQIVTNLLSNAVKYTEQGHIELVAHMREVAADRCVARIVVRDTGAGMSAEVAARIFQPFVQGDDSLARRHGGTGLGLSIALGLAQSIGGSLTLDTAPGRGSSFTLEVPLRVQPGEQPAVGLPPPGTAWLVHTRARPAQSMQQRLQRLGWSCDAVGGMAELMARAGSADTPPDLVLLSESALEADTDLGWLRSLLPQTNIVLLARPDWNEPKLESEARLAQIPLIFMPVTPAALLDLLCMHGPQSDRIVSGFSTLAGLPIPVESTSDSDVLVVEDNMVNQVIVCEMIDALGLRTRLAEDGGTAVEACRERAPALVLMDLQMPGVDGLEATRQLRVLQKRGSIPTFPIIALTAHATPQDRDSCLAAGMVGYLTKPVAMAELRNELSRWLRC